MPQEVMELGEKARLPFEVHVDPPAEALNVAAQRGQHSRSGPHQSDRDQHTKGTEQEQAGGVKWRLQDGITFETCDEFHQYADPSQAESPGQILLLTGYLSLEWLGSIGSRYRVDSEFFNRFLVFRSINDRLSCFSVPPLPSSEWNLIKLSLLTIGLRTSYNPQFSTLLVWTVWTDGGSLAGSDFMENPLSKALRLSSSFGESLLPIVVYKPMMGLNAHLLAKHCAVRSLHSGYSRFLRQSLASGHSFIALTEVFTLVASSKKHFLNMMELKLERAELNTGGK
ncbi:hypothetical protein MY4038_010119, partial [Beauveria bassiana]